MWDKRGPRGPGRDRVLVQGGKAAKPSKTGSEESVLPTLTPQTLNPNPRR